MILSLAFILGVGVLSCKRTTEPEQTPVHFSKFQFPASVGSWWKYAIIDTLLYTYTGKIEISYGEVKVTILDSTTLPNGKSAKIWQYKYTDHIDTLYSSFSGDTLIFYNLYKQHLSEKFAFLLPLEAGKEWDISCCEYKAFLSEIVQVPAGTFENVINVREHERQGNALGWNNYFIAPYVGLIKYRYHTFVTLFEKNHKIEWKLLSYNLTE